MKPQKPTPDFPLFAHANGQWAAKIGDKLRYFGAWPDPDAALARFHGNCEPTPYSKGNTREPTEKAPEAA
jgi:hypothetical protein